MRTRKKDSPLAKLLSGVKIGGIILALGGGGSGAYAVWSKLDLVNTAMAQATTKADAALEDARHTKTRLEAIDAGTRAALDRFEAKMDAKEERAQKDRDEQRAMLQALIRKVDKL